MIFRIVWAFFRMVGLLPYRRAWPLCSAPVCSDGYFFWENVEYKTEQTGATLSGRLRLRSHRCIACRNTLTLLTAGAPARYPRRRAARHRLTPPPRGHALAVGSGVPLVIGLRRLLAAMPSPLARAIRSLRSPHINFPQTFSLIFYFIGR